MQPLLSICIPTWNRADLLRDFLLSLSQHITPYLDQVEIVISDNASTDHTQDIIASSGLPITHGKQSSTVGFTKNVLSVTTELARGEFIWVVGDDDLILPSAIATILDSITKHPELDYHYLNFGWINAKKRAEIIHEHNNIPHEQLLKRRQFTNKGTHVLNKIESLVEFDCDNISAAFSGIFCFVARRSLFVNGKTTLSPSDSLDGSSTNISDCFPHAMLTLPALAGKPVAFIGELCVLQGVSSWEWGSYAYKNMIFGTYQLFTWLASTPFSNDAMTTLWNSYYEMAGRLFFRMQHLDGEHKGLDIVMSEAIPKAACKQVFWDSFMNEAEQFHAVEAGAEVLASLTHEVLTKHHLTKIGMWGLAGRGAHLIAHHSDIRHKLIWATDKDVGLHGIKLDKSELVITAPETIKSVSLEILIIGTRKEFIDDVIAYAKPLLPAGVIIISMNGTQIV